jgi:hypothetical protein
MLDTMTKNAKRPIRRNEHAGREPVVITSSVVVLAVVVVICAALLVPPLWTAAVEVWRLRPLGQQCSEIADVAARQACHEELSVRATRHPAKGANAPLILEHSEQRSE